VPDTKLHHIIKPWPLGMGFGLYTRDSSFIVEGTSICASLHRLFHQVNKSRCSKKYDTGNRLVKRNRFSTNLLLLGLVPYRTNWFQKGKLNETAPSQLPNNRYTNQNQSSYLKPMIPRFVLMFFNILLFETKSHLTGVIFSDQKHKSI
jgi:hypothetical protein